MGSAGRVARVVGEKKVVVHRLFCGDIHLKHLGVDGRILGEKEAMDWIHLA
jgi:hypothetical protein